MRNAYYVVVMMRIVVFIEERHREMLDEGTVPVLVALTSSPHALENINVLKQALAILKMLSESRM